MVTPKNQVGTYGGTFFGASMAPETTSDFQLSMVTGLLRYSNDLSENFPEVASGYEFNEDFTACTITLRQGIRWSDGEPFTANDIMFYFEAWQLDPEVMPTPAAQWRWAVKSSASRWSTTTPLSSPSRCRIPPSASSTSLAVRPSRGGPGTTRSSSTSATTPTPKPLPPKPVSTPGSSTSSNRIADTTWNYGAQNPDLPVLGPWRPVSNDTQRQQYERNPYYFKVDTEGNQLPYVDYVTIDYAGDPEIMNLRAISGELSVAGLDLQLINYPVIRDGEESGGYTTTLVYSERGLRRRSCLQPGAPGPGPLRAVPGRAVPPGDVTRDQPRGDQRDRLPRPGHDSPGDDQ